MSGKIDPVVSNLIMDIVYRCSNVEEVKDKAQQLAKHVKRHPTSKDTKQFIALMLLDREEKASIVFKAMDAER